MANNEEKIKVNFFLNDTPKFIKKIIKTQTLFDLRKEYNDLKDEYIFLTNDKFKKKKSKIIQLKIA